MDGVRKKTIWVVGYRQHSYPTVVVAEVDWSERKRWSGALLFVVDLSLVRVVHESVPCESRAEAPGRRDGMRRPSLFLLQEA